MIYNHILNYDYRKKGDNRYSRISKSFYCILKQFSQEKQKEMYLKQIKNDVFKRKKGFLNSS